MSWRRPLGKVMQLEGCTDTGDQTHDFPPWAVQLLLESSFSENVLRAFRGIRTRTCKKTHLSHDMYLSEMRSSYQQL